LPYLIELRLKFLNDGTHALTQKEYLVALVYMKPTVSHFEFLFDLKAIFFIYISSIDRAIFSKSFTVE
jgi:hypothetical protein